MKKWRYLLIASILIFTLACGLVDVARNLTGGDDEPEVAVQVTDEADDSVVDDEGDADVGDNDVQAEDDEVEPEDNSDGTADDEALTLDENALDMLDSYRVSIYWEVDYADGSNEVIDMTMSTTRDPEAYQYEMFTEGEEIEMIQIGNTMWIRYGDQWMSSTSEEMESDDGFGDFLISGTDMDMDNWSKDDYTYLGKETVNGINTRHYQAEYNDFWAGVMTQEEVEDIEDATADFWVADEKDLPNFVVKMSMTVAGTFAEQDGEWTIEQEVYDINETFTIEAPEGVGSGLPEGVPEYPGAEDFASFGGMITFTTSDAVEDVAEFYTDGLASGGWSQDEYSELGPMVMATYSKDGQTLTLTITSDEESGTTVLLMVE